MFNSKISRQPDFGIFTHLYIVHGFFAKNGLKLTYNFITPFERSHFELSEKPKRIVIIHSELKLLPFKDFLLFLLFCVQVHS